MLVTLNDLSLPPPPPPPPVMADIRPDPPPPATYSVRRLVVSPIRSVAEESRRLPIAPASPLAPCARPPATTPPSPDCLSAAMSVTSWTRCDGRRSHGPDDRRARPAAALALLPCPLLPRPLRLPRRRCPLRR